MPDYDHLIVKLTTRKGYVEIFVINALDKINFSNKPLSLFQQNCFHVCHCLGTGHFARGLLAPSWCCALFCLVFHVHMLFGCHTGGICSFSCGVNVIVINFVGKWIMAYWKFILSAWQPIRWRPMSHWKLYMLSCYNFI